MKFAVSRAFVLRGALCAAAILAVGAPALAQQGVNGGNVTSVDAAGSKFVLTPSGWEERNRDGKFTFREDRRDAWSVYLSDPARGVRLQLDLHARKVLYAEGGGPMSELYAITGSSAQVNGRNVVRVNFSGGSYALTAPGRWVEQGTSGGRFDFAEQRRDDWSVYLEDRSRGVRIQLDLHTRQVKYAEGNGPMSNLYPITGSSAIR